MISMSIYKVFVLDEGIFRVYLTKAGIALVCYLFGVVRSNGRSLITRMKYPQQVPKWHYHPLHRPISG